MRMLTIGVAISLVCGCSTPGSVKEATRRQAASYEELLETARDFRAQRTELYRQVLELERQSQLRISYLRAAIELGGEGDTPVEVPSSAIQSRFEQAAAEAESQFRSDSAETEAALADTSRVLDGIRDQILALRAIQGAVADYLAYDLAPDGATVEELIQEVRAVAGTESDAQGGAQ